MSAVASPDLRITAIETVQLPQYQNILCFARYATWSATRWR
jgi:hypothetical protein